MNHMTKGEALVAGVEQIRQGLEMIGKAGRPADLTQVLVGSSTGARRLREVMGPGLFQQMIVSMVASRNSRLNPDTVRKVVYDFLDVIVDLAQPYETPGEEEQPEVS